MKKQFLYFIFIIIPFFISAQEWVQLGQDINGEVAEKFLGQAVNLSNGGEQVTITEGHNNGGGDITGPEYIYEFLDEKWTLVNPAAPTVNSDAILEENEDPDYINQSGVTVKISDDKSTLAISSLLYNQIGNFTGYVRVYKKIKEKWVPFGQDLDIETDDDQSERSISLSKDGNIIAVGAPLHSTETKDIVGHVRVFKIKNGTWIQLGENITGKEAFDQFGSTVTLSDDGTIVAIGAPFHDKNGINSGQVQTYIYEEGNWVKMGSDINGENEHDQSGSDISISEDKTTIAIGAILNDGNGSDSGHVRLYKYENDNWLKIGSDINGSFSNDFFGTSVSLSADGTRVVIGAPFNSGKEINSGQVRIYKLDPTIIVPPTLIISSTEPETTGADIIPIQFAFNKPVMDFTVDDIQVSNAFKSDLVLNNDQLYSLEITPIEKGEISITVNENTFEDLDGNINIEASIFFISSDKTLSTDLFQGNGFYINTKKPFLSIKSNQPVHELSITNIHGVLVLSTINHKKVNIESLPTGVYFLKVSTDTHVINRKILIR